MITETLYLSNQSTLFDSMKPATRYTKSGRINIAYQVFGSGPVDLVYIPGWVSNIDMMWACPELVDFLQELGKVARVILFDKRGTGLSDRVVELSTLEERMDDIRAVMDAVSSEKAILFGHSEGGSVSALFAATYPDRTISLITFGVFAKRRYSEEYPWAPTDRERQHVYDMIEKSWGSGDMNLETLAPSKGNDREFMEWLSNYFRSGASPSAAMVLTRMNTEVDIIKILGSIKVPALIMQRTRDIDVRIEEGRFIAERIPNARFVEFDGEDHLFWVGNTGEVLDEMKAFIGASPPHTAYEQRLYTILTINTVAAKEDPLSINERIEHFISQYRGTVLEYTEGMVMATFEGPSKAVHCGIDLIHDAENLPRSYAMAIHIKEVSVQPEFKIDNDTKTFMKAMVSQAGADQLLITQTVKYLLSGAGLHFNIHNVIFNPVSNESSQLYSVSDRDDAPSSKPIGSLNFTQTDSLLESTLKSIDNHLDDPEYDIAKLCDDVALSERQLQRKIKAITNKSPKQLITSVRLHRAKELLINRKGNITEIAFQTGFSNPSYFTKCFKKEFGISPSSMI